MENEGGSKIYFISSKGDKSMGRKIRLQPGQYIKLKDGNVGWIDQVKRDQVYVTLLDPEGGCSFYIISREDIMEKITEANFRRREAKIWQQINHNR